MIEDDETLRELIAETLRDEACEVLAMPDGHRGIRALRDWNPDVVLLDLMMPNLDGAGFIAASRLDMGARQNTPVIIVSARSDAPRLAVEMGVHGCLTKPFDLEDLIDLVMSALEEQSLSS